VKTASSFRTAWRYHDVFHGNVPRFSEGLGSLRMPISLSGYGRPSLHAATLPSFAT
jgi:hypothetical protein